MFKIVVITPETGHPDESHILEFLVKEYGCQIHIRKPNFDKESYKKYLQNHNRLLSHFVLHEHHSLAKEFQVKGIHLKERDRKGSNLSFNELNIVSTSIHSIKDAAHLKHSFEYIFYSPLFESISKQSYGSNKTYEELTESVFELKKNTSIPIMGLGGIDEENIELVKKSGFDGAGLLGSVWGARDPVATIKLLFSNNR
ncbi:thiamine phosphate synthase [uncultured Cytophaga sp.]|uniref:thiamine phosphate synthase n=1 Tax=uncultured Cytophaga sp. TaxID=160238 RepID=UPI0026327307|nr:thiamine phosphate synthase [uncultured Cytophaga sp.]